jgi:hypothetical protein
MTVYSHRKTEGSKEIFRVPYPCRYPSEKRAKSVQAKQKRGSTEIQWATEPLLCTSVTRLCGVIATKCKNKLN